jgi:hypothetical protein
MTDRALIVAALIVGGAIVAASLQARARYALSGAGSNVVWRMDTWSGQIDLCTASNLQAGPLVRCGAVVIVPAPSQPSDDAAKPPNADPAPGQLDSPRGRGGVGERGQL